MLLLEMESMVSSSKELSQSQKQSASAAFWSIANRLRGESSLVEHGPLLLAIVAQAFCHEEHPFWVRWSQDDSSSLTLFSVGLPDVKSEWAASDFSCFDSDENRLRYIAEYSEELIRHTEVSSQLLRESVESLLELSLPQEALTSLAIDAAFKLLSASVENRQRGVRESSPAKAGLAELVQSMLAVKSGESVYDSTIGLGSLLGAISNASTSGEIEYWGQEINQATAAFTRFVFALRKENMHLACGDSLHNPPTQDGELQRFDAVIVDPPWGMRTAKDSVQFAGLPGRDPREEYQISSGVEQGIAFLINGLEAANPQSGRVVALLPHSVLFRSGSGEKARAQIMRMADLKLSAVVGLKPMFTWTGVPFVVAMFAPAAGKVKTTFIDATGDEFYSPSGALRPEAVVKITKTILNRETSEGFCATVSQDEILNNDSSWSPSRYIPVKEMEVSDPAVASSIFHESSTALRESESNLLELLDELRDQSHDNQNPQL
jgi:hypothetical protein